MFTITFSSDEGEGDLLCPFCRGEFGLPFGVLVRGSDIEPTPSSVINEHCDPGVVDDSATSIERCPNWNTWKTIRWEAHDQAATPSLFQAGEVVVHRNGTIDVATTFRQA